VLDQDRVPQYDDASITENTRCAYPVDYIEGAALPSLGANPNHIFFLTCDAFGVLPPIAKLNSDQAMEYFLMGYTAKVAGTETGVTEPVAVFSACFGQPFLPLSPNVYANLLKQKIVQHNPQVWLVNTGWTGGPYGKGERIPLKYTREILHAALGGKLDQVAFSEDPVFGLSIPKECPGVPSQILFPRSTWENPSEYDAKAEQLKKMFEKHIQH
jgi:phosphoenolpyruvate carboxykinase (ATP)